ncbi:MAG: putative quinol monooxygenase [Syntrophaceae bacterium]
MVHVIAVVEIASGRREAFLKEFHKVVPFVRVEEGCIEYGPAIDLETDFAAPVRDDVVTIIEKWEDIHSLKAHLGTPHMLEYRKRVKDLVERTTVHVLQNA